MATRTEGRPPVAPRRGWATPTYDEMLDKKRQQETQYRRANDANYDQSQEMPQPQEASRRESSFYATLPLGPKSSSSEIQRSKERYRHELEQQIREAADGKRREKQQEMKVSYSAMNGPLTGTGENSGDHKVGFGHSKPSDGAPKVDYGNYKQPDIITMPASGRRVRNSHVEPYHSKILDSLAKLDQISPRSEVVLGRKRLDEVGMSSDLGLGTLNLSRGPSRGGPAILDAGFEGLLEAPRISSLAPPPGLLYQPASYITSGSSGLGLSSVDEAYNFYATRNPLDAFNLQGPSGGGGGGGGVGDGSGGRLRHANAEQELSFSGGGGGGGGGRTGRTPRVRFNEDARRTATGQMDFPTDEDKKREAQGKARTYQEELQQQIEEKNRKKFMEREEKERFERKLAQEALEYNPFGKGGGGAPMRDQYGNLVTDLRQMKRENDNPDYHAPPRAAAAPVSSGRGPPYQSPRGPSSVRDDLFGPPPVQTTGTGEQSYARGGHGIFGMPKTDAEKLASEKYKEDLKRQIETKKMEDMRKRDLERQEEEQEMRRVEEQQARMKVEYEEEKRRTMEKEEEARRRNEELVRQAEERKRETERRRREEEDRRMEDQRRERDAEINARLAEARAAGVTSPPVPAARRQATQDDLQPSTSKQDAAPLQRAASGDVLNQLALMRQQLQNERQRVESLLHHEKNEPDVFDPRLVQKPPPVPISKPEVDVFEMSRNRNAVHVRRTPAERANSQALEDFYSLRHKESSDSRKEFNRLFPEAPTSGDTLETQQAVLLQRQEDTLRRLRDQSAYPKTSVTRSPSGTPQQLHSDSAFVDVDNLNHFPDDFDDIPASRRNDTARARRRNVSNAGYSRRDSSPRVRTPGQGGNGYTDPFGSTTSLNVDRLAKKNEERLRRLNEMKGDEISLYEADDVLDRFMSKQAHNRPPSGQTLQDDTWMFAGSKMSGY